MIEQKKVSRYLLYAIGEIILVVIGILIALQINNWNEAKINTAFEIRMLKELSSAIQKDIEVANNVLDNRIREKEKSVEYFKNLIKKDSIDADSLNYYFTWITTGSLFQFNRGPYEGLKSIGLDRISNDTIRNKVQLLYDSTIPKLVKLMEWVESIYGDEQMELLDQFRKAAHYEIINDTVVFKKSLVERSFWKESDFIEALILAQSRSQYNRMYFEMVRNDFIDMKKMIKDEIYRLENL